MKYIFSIYTLKQYIHYCANLGTAIGQNLWAQVDLESILKQLYYKNQSNQEER